MDILLIKESLQYIELHIVESLSVAEISSAMGYSEFYFSRKFKKIMKVTVMEYVKKRKLQKASEEILRGGKIIDAALHYGWQTHSGFTKAFKQEFGFCPALLKAMEMQIKELGGSNMGDILLKKTEVHFSKDRLFQCLMDEMAIAKIEFDYKELKDIYAFSEKIYEGKKRYSGDEYVTHPLNVAILLAQMNADRETIYAGLFCDAVEKIPVKIEQIKDKLPVRTLSILQKAAMTKNAWIDDQLEDEVILLKLAERLHNMRTAQFVKEDQRRKKAKETLQQILPVARRMGNISLLDELFDLSLKYLRE